MKCSKCNVELEKRVHTGGNNRYRRCPKCGRFQVIEKEKKNGKRN